jgi:hypothetical protein
MLRAIIVLLAFTLTAQAQNGEIILSCDGVAGHVYSPGKKFVTARSLIVNMTNRFIIWNDTYAGFTSWLSPEEETHVIKFGYNYNFAGNIPTKNNPYVPHLDGSIDRVTGRTTIFQGAFNFFDSADDTHDDKYDLLCRPAKPLF